MGTIIVGIAVAAIVAAIVAGLVKKARRGETACGCGCDKCHR
jgi:hypothetical protein